MAGLGKFEAIATLTAASGVYAVRVGFLCSNEMRSKRRSHSGSSDEEERDEAGRAATALDVFMQRTPECGSHPMCRPFHFKSALYKYSTPAKRVTTQKDIDWPWFT